MSAAYIFGIKGTKISEMFYFLKGLFSVMGGPMDMIFGVLLETFLKLLKSIILQFFSKYSKSSKNLNAKMLKTPLPLKKRWTVKRPPNYVVLIELNKGFLEWS